MVYQVTKKQTKASNRMLPLPELDTRSVLNVVEENFQKLSLKAYAIRMIYIGEHTLSKEEIIKHFSETIAIVNSSYCEINVTGLLLVYDSYFVHILEGSEDTVHRHIRFIFRREQEWIAEMNKLDAMEEAPAEGLTVLMAENTEPQPERKMFRRLKLVMTYHSICTFPVTNKTLPSYFDTWGFARAVKALDLNVIIGDISIKRPLRFFQFPIIRHQKYLIRQFTNWRAITARPPSLIGKLDLYGPLPDHMEQLRIFLNKMMRIVGYAQADDQLSFEGLKPTDSKVEALPEVALIDFLLQSQYILPLRETAALHRRVDDYEFFYEQVWPVQTHYTPRFLFKLKIDDSFVEPLPVMPWEVVKKGEGEDEEKEEREETEGSSSD